MSEIIINDLTKIYGRNDNLIYALNKISFSLNYGMLTVILGPSGSGKSTLLNILGGMDKATSGSIMILDKEITTLKEKDLISYRRDDIGFVFQFYNLLPNLTALENVLLCENNTSDFNAITALNLVGLEKRLKNFPSQLSGGEQQRVAIARAIVKNPKLLLCDEPTGALDSKTGKTIITLLQKLAKEKKRSVVVVTHNPLLAQAADRVIELNDGMIVKNVIQTPVNAEDINFNEK